MPSYNDVAELAYPGLFQAMKKLIFDRKLRFELHFFYPHLWIALEPPFSWCCYHCSFCVFVSVFYPKEQQTMLVLLQNQSRILHTHILHSFALLFFTKCPADILVCFLTFACSLLCSLVVDVLVDLVLTLCVHSCLLPHLMCRTAVIFFYKHIFKTGSASLH